MQEEQLNKLLGGISIFLIGTFSGAIGNIYGVVKGNVFSIAMFFFQALIGGFVTIVAHEFIPMDWDIRIGLLWILGFLGVKILDIVDKKGIDLMIKKYIDKDHKISEEKEVEKTEEKPISDNI